MTEKIKYELDSDIVEFLLMILDNPEIMKIIPIISTAQKKGSAIATNQYLMYVVNQLSGPLKAKDKKPEKPKQKDKNA